MAGTFGPTVEGASAAAPVHTLPHTAVTVLVSLATSVDERPAALSFLVIVEIGEGGTAGTRVRARHALV